MSKILIVEDEESIAELEVLKWRLRMTGQKAFPRL